MAEMIKVTIEGGGKTFELNTEIGVWDAHGFRRVNFEEFIRSPKELEMTMLEAARKYRVHLKEGVDVTRTAQSTDASETA